MKKYFEIDLHRFTTKNNKEALESMQDVSEWVFNWSINNDGGAYDIKLDDCRHDIDQAYTYIYKQTGVPVNELKEKYADSIESDFRRAMADAYRSNYESEWLKSFYESMQQNITKALNDVLYKQAYFVYTDKNTKKVHKVLVSTDFHSLSWCWEASTIRIYATTKQLSDFVGVYKDYTWDDYAYEAVESINCASEYVDTEYIDYYGTMGDGDNWFDFFKDAEDTSAQVKQDIIKKAEQTRAYIKHNVPLIYRIA